jgi:hypothetical protein
MQQQGDLQVVLRTLHDTQNSFQAAQDQIAHKTDAIW